MPTPAHDIAHLCSLARLKLDQREQLSVERDLNRIIHMVDAIAAVATDAVDPLAHPLDANARLRHDRVTERVDRDALQRGAPATRDGLYLVPRVIE
jgi:aspartyl-tRNA(Asn)/glutamyl-tRNA(Gln) amidotransferase subunit C